MTESFLQYVWQYQLLEGSLTTTDGQLVRVLNVGMLNRDAGPDFLSSRLRIGDMEWAGNVEVHLKSSDWNKHRHSQDLAYDNVVLHVVYEHDAEVVACGNRGIPTLELKHFIPIVIWNNYEALLDPPEVREIACADKLHAITPVQFNAYLERLLVERLQRKTDMVRRMLKESNGSWEHVCYWMIAHYFGGVTNALTFELLAKNTDYRLLSRWKDNPQRLEALLFGQAGLLEPDFQDEYPLLLRSDYTALRTGANLSPLAGHLWRFFRLRPSAFPTLRISQFAQLLSKNPNLFSQLLDFRDVERLEAFFMVAASDYWTTHYQFDAPSRPCKKSTGKPFVVGLIINAWIPLLFEYGVQHGSEEHKDLALELLSQLRPEKNKIVSYWNNAGVEVENAFQSQALIQLYNEYCKNKKCLQCRLGYYAISKS